MRLSLYVPEATVRGSDARSVVDGATKGGEREQQALDAMESEQRHYGDHQDRHERPPKTAPGSLRNPSLYRSWGLPFERGSRSGGLLVVRA